MSAPPLKEILSCRSQFSSFSFRLLNGGEDFRYPFDLRISLVVLMMTALGPGFKTRGL